MEDNTLTVGMGEYVVAHNPHKLRIIGLGSCIGVSVYAIGHHCGALAHVMLPMSTEYGVISGNPNKYADICIPAMVKELMRKYPDIRPGELRAKITGGAHMFPGIGPSPGAGIDIGAKNIAAVKKTLDSLNIRVDAEDLGGTNGRTMSFDLSTNLVEIRTRDSVRTI